MFLKNRNIISKIKISKVTDYAALGHKGVFGVMFLVYLLDFGLKGLLIKIYVQTV